MPVLLIDPRHAQRAPGRPPTARLAGTWLQRLPTYGVLAGALRPEAHGGVLRGSRRHRQLLLPSAAPQVPPRHKACAQRHLTRTQVVRERTGVTGLALLKAMRAGERDPPHLATLRHPHCHPTEDDIATARQGPWRAAHLCA